MSKETIVLQDLGMKGIEVRSVLVNIAFGSHEWCAPLTFSDHVVYAASGVFDTSELALTAEVIRKMEYECFPFESVNAGKIIAGQWLKGEYPLTEVLVRADHIVLHYCRSIRGLRYAHGIFVLMPRANYRLKLEMALSGQEKTVILEYWSGYSGIEAGENRCFAAWVTEPEHADDFKSKQPDLENTVICTKGPMFSSINALIEYLGV